VSWRVGGLLFVAILTTGAGATIAAPASGGDGGLPTGVPRGGGPTYRGSLTRIISPHAGTLVTGGRLGVSIRSGASLRTLDVRLNGRSIAKRLSASRGGVFTAVIAVGRLLHRGQDLLTVATNARGHFDFDDRNFEIARRAPGLVTLRRIRTRQAAAPVTVLGRVAGRVTLRVWVNGHHATSAFTSRSTGGKLVGLLGADDGLRDGINHLVIVADRSSRERAEETTISRTFVIPSTAVIASAGQDRTVLDGQFVRLNGTWSLLARGDRGRSFLWRIVQAPHGSRARLLHARSSRPLLVPDLPGTYRVRLTLATHPPTSGRRRGPPLLTGTHSAETVTRSADTVTLTAQPNDPYGVPLQSNVSSGGEFGSIGLDGRPLPDTGRTHALGISYAVIDRTTLQLQSSGQLSLSSDGFNQLLAIAKRYSDGRSLMVFNWQGAFAAALRATLAATFKQVGGGEFPSYDFLVPNAPGSVIGIPGAPAGVAFFDHGEFVRSAANMSGYLRRNGVTDRFDFVFTSYVPLDTAASGTSSTASVITVGDRRYTYTHNANISGFHVVILDPKSLAPISNRGYVTNGVSNPDTTYLVEDLRSASNRLDRPLVIVQSFGLPVANAVTWDRAALAIQKMGGTRQVFLDLNQPYAGGPGTDPTQGRKGGYAFVGRTGGTAPPAEVSGPLDGVPARLKGLLMRTRTADYEPLLVAEAQPDGAAPVNEELLQIANQAPTPFPDLAPGAPPDQVQAAENFLGGPQVMRVCPAGVTCNVRQTYYTNYGGSWQTIAGDLANAKSKCLAPPPDVAPAVCEQVRSQLFDEVQAANRVRHYLGPNGLQQPFGAAGVAALANLGEISDAIQKAVNPKPADNTVSNVLNLLSNVSKLGAVAGPPVSTISGGVSAVLGFGAYLTKRDSGPNLIGPELQATVARLGTELTARYRDAGDQLDGLGRIIVSDYGKLMAVAGKVDSDPNWIIGTPGSSRETLIRAAKQTISETLISRVYPVLYDLGYPADRQARRWYCKYTVVFVHKTKHLFHEPDAGQVVMRFPNGWNPVMAVAGAYATGHESSARINSPPANVIDPLFAPPALGGLGMKKLEFYSPRLFRLFPPEPAPFVGGTRRTLAMTSPDAVPHCESLPNPPGNSS
jgi:hypothetical protein